MGKIVCLNCNTVLESKHRHDFVSCGCENDTFVDGGLYYTRSGGKDMSLVLSLSNNVSTRFVLYAKWEDRWEEVYSYHDLPTKQEITERMENYVKYWNKLWKKPDGGDKYHWKLEEEIIDTKVKMVGTYER